MALTIYSPVDRVGCYIDVPGTGLAVRLQNPQCSWVLHHCMANVPPMELGHTLAVRLQNPGWGWILRHSMANVPPMELDFDHWMVNVAPVVFSHILAHPPTLIIHSFP